MDTVSPVVSNVTVSGEGEERMLSFDVTDASPIAGYGFKTDPDGALTLLERQQLSELPLTTTDSTTSTSKPSSRAS